MTVEDPAALPVGSEAPSSPGRGGRNLPAAIAVGLTMGGLAVGSLVAGRAAFDALVTIAVLVAVWELRGALAGRVARPPLVPLLIGSVAMPVAAHRGGTEGLMVALALTVVGVFGWRLSEGPIGYAADVTAGVFTAAYVPFLAGFAVLLDEPSDGTRRVVTYVLVVVCNDVGGYAAGVLFGKHPMAPRISPKKSWEGMAGSLVACAVAGAVCMSVVLHGHWLPGAAFGIVLAVAATTGDLGESVLKRDIGVKDMGTLLPGHGGIMDRLDSLLAAAPVAWLMLAAFQPR